MPYKGQCHLYHPNNPHYVTQPNGLPVPCPETQRRWALGGYGKDVEPPRRKQRRGQ
jgi:hypothetical protein